SIDIRELHMGPKVGRSQLCLALLKRDRPIELPCPVKRLSHMVIRGIEALSQFPFLDPLVGTSHLSQETRVLVVCIRVAGSELDHPLVLLFSACPIPFVAMSNRSAIAVFLREATSKFQCLQQLRLLTRHPSPIQSM